MQSRVVFLKPKLNSGVKKSLPRFYVDLIEEAFNPNFDYCLIEGEYPIYITKNKVAHDIRPTLSHFLIDGEFPAMLGFGYISSKRTKLYDGVMRELYHECALSTTWGRDWPTPAETVLMSSKEKKREKKLTKWLPKSPDYPPL
ncbi:non-structural protein [Tehran virus]|uniref:Non-structural protein n=1 Tax=Tehran virus TaxID=206161 RepID=R4I444_9VIRU|nr:non-structural protein [Tehran virus]AFH89014.1 non-structural protein [Tehran virus]